MSVDYSEELFQDFCEFSTQHLRTQDNDPIYPWFREVYKQKGFTEREQLWYTYLYTAFYSVESTLTLWDIKGYCEPQEIPVDELELPTGTERRCFRGQPEPAYKNITQALEADFFNPDTWSHFTGEDGWDETRDLFEEVAWNGPWASYKWADLMKHVMGYDITASDIGVGGKSKTAGPIPGMVKITNEHWKECATNVELQKEVMGRCVDEFDVPFTGLDEFETCLCDFNSASKGTYYVGHDIDLYGGQLADIEDEHNRSYDVHWTARDKAFPDFVLGEHNSWQGSREHLMNLYADQGVIRWWKQDDYDVTYKTDDGVHTPLGEL